MNRNRTDIHALVSGIEPFDAEERAVVRRVRAWIDSGASLFRGEGAEGDAMHLVSYFPLVDRARRSLLLVDHIKAGLWLPTGGHVEPGEDPHGTVVRELQEELGPRVMPLASIAAAPLFVTANQTRGGHIHTDVSLWYVVFGDEKMWVDPDPREFSGHRWMRFEMILEMSVGELDPGMHRFVRKLQQRLGD